MVVVLGGGAACGDNGAREAAPADEAVVDSAIPAEPAATEPTEAIPASSEDDDGWSGFGPPLSCLSMDERGWSRSTELVDRIYDAQLAANDEAVVAVGPGPEHSRYAVALHSSDGLSWRSTEGFPSLSFGGPEVKVVGGPKGFVAAWTTDGPGVVHSADGSKWEEIDRDALPDIQIVRLVDVFAGPDGFLIVGANHQGSLVIWFSDDGRNWMNTDLPATDIKPAVAATDSGWAAVTASEPGAGESQARVWTSSDGTHWSQVRTSSVPDADVLDVIVGTSPLVVTGDTWVLAEPGADDVEHGFGFPVVWVSIDGGATWTEHSVGGDFRTNGFRIHDFIVTERILILSGYQDRWGEPGRYFLHHSPDGIAWQHCWTDPHELTSIELHGDGIVAYDSGSGAVLVWNEP